MFKKSKRRGAKAKAAHGDLIWVKPDLIRYKLTAKTIIALRAGDDLSEDWDLQRTDIERGGKYRSLMLHFREGRRWTETPIFRRYAARFNRGEVIRGCRSIEELERVYQEDMDGLYESLRRRGFLSRRLFIRRRKDLPNVYLGRDGEIIFGAEGNHRLALAKVLGLNEIPCRVLERHPQWAALRLRLMKMDLVARKESISPALADHPDLRKLLYPRSRLVWWRSTSSAKPG
jgi:hypothetical protein